MYPSSFGAGWVNTEKAPGFATLNVNTGWRFDNVSSWLTKPQLKIPVTNLTDKWALTFANTTNLLATPGAATDVATGRNTLQPSNATYNLSAPRAVMVTLRASFF